MSIERARAHLKDYGFEGRIMEFNKSSATVELAASAVGVIPARIAKTLSFKAADDTILIVAAGDAKVDNAKYKTVFRTKAKMLTNGEVETLTGHAVGGVCPFGVIDGVKTYLDVSLKRFDTVFPAAGTASSAVRLTCEELFLCSCAVEWIDVCKAWQDNEV